MWCDSTIIDDVMAFLATLSSSKLGSFRYVAVATTMILGREIIGVYSGEREAFDKIQRQFEAEVNKKKKQSKKKKKRKSSPLKPDALVPAIRDYVSKDSEDDVDDDSLQDVLKSWVQEHSDSMDARLIQLGRMATAMARKVRRLKLHIMYAFQAVVVHRYRDVHAPIRSECISGFGRWIEAAPEILCSEKYTRYVGWTLYDKDAGVREACLRAVKGILSACTVASPMRKFASRFASRISEMFLDASPDVVVAAFEVVNELLRLGLALRDKDDDSGQASMGHRAARCLFTPARIGCKFVRALQRFCL